MAWYTIFVPPAQSSLRTDPFTNSQEPSKKAYDFDAEGLEADYYITWIHRRADNLNHLRHVEDDEDYRTSNPERFLTEQMCFEANFPDSSRETIIALQLPDNKRSTKQTNRDGRPLWVNVHWKDSFSIQYRGAYTNKVSSSYKYEHSQSDHYDFSGDCEMYFGAVRDDNGHPFLRLRFEYGPSDKKRRKVEPWGPIEMIAKKITDDGPGEFGKRDLSKNEKLRLGFPMDARGNFSVETRLLKQGTTPAQVADDEGTVESLMENVQVTGAAYLAARGKAAKKLEECTRELNIMIQPTNSPTISQRAEPFVNGNANRNKRGRHSDGDLNGRPNGHINGLSNGNLNRQTISSSNETDASPLSARDVSLVSPPQISLQRSSPVPTDAADELAAPESSRRAAKRARLSNGKGHQ